LPALAHTIPMAEPSSASNGDPDMPAPHRAFAVIGVVEQSRLGGPREYHRPAAEPAIIRGEQFFDRTIGRS